MGCHFLLQGIFLTQGSFMSPALADGFFTSSTTWANTILQADAKSMGQKLSR